MSSPSPSQPYLDLCHCDVLRPAPPRRECTITGPPRRGQLHVAQATLTDSMFPSVTTSAVESVRT
ncbi:hypothetical protein PR003_g1016 [Phytophthora rubi]|nr:hypothetical protein PR003_g1016 [Phytophthora rubi]